MSGLGLPAVGWLLGAAIWFWWLRRYDRFEPEPLGALLGVGVLGGVASAMAPVLAEGAFSSLSGVSVPKSLGDPAMAPGAAAMLAMFVGAIEEVTKAIAAVSLTRRLGHLNEPIDAVLYAMITALGFSVLENLLYASKMGPAVLLPRYVLSTPVHVVLALVWGNAWAKGRFLLPGQPLWKVMAPAVLHASVLHGAWDYAAFVRSPPGMLSAFVSLAVLLAWAHGTSQAMAMESPFISPGLCPRCGGTSMHSARHCRHCGGTMFGTYFVQCATCHGRVSASARFCPGCGVGRGAA